MSTVRTHSGQETADGVGTHPLRERLEQDIHRGYVSAHRRALDQANAVLATQPMHLAVSVAARRDENVTAQDAISLARLAHADSALDVEPLREVAGEAGRHVLHDDDSRCPRGQLRQDATQRRHSPGGGADADHLVCGLTERRRLLRAGFTAKPRGGSISGQVKDEQGRAIGNARVDITGPAGATMQTSMEGLFALLEAPEGTYRLRVDAPGYFLQVVELEVRSRETAIPQIILLRKSGDELVVRKANELAIVRGHSVR